MKICVSNDSFFNFGDLDWGALEALGDVRIYHTHTKDINELARRIGDAEILISDTPADLPNGLIAMCPNLKYISLTSTGYDSVELDVASARGIQVSNIPSYGTASVAQYAISLLLEICGQVGYYSAAVHAGRWSDCGPDTAHVRRLIELDGKTMGIIGLGRIGQAVARAARSLGMEVIAYNRSRSAQGEAVAEYVALDELFRRADVISLHCPANAETAGIINAHTIDMMKPGVIIINNSRGALIDSRALAQALNSGRVYAAGLDVIESEPIARDNPLLSAKNCFITPHISWLPKESRQRVVDCTVENIRAYLRGAPQNVVN